jgi:hypothetical protein
MYGWPGVATGGGATHVVSFGMPKSTIVAVVRARDGVVLRSSVIRGFYGIPLVAYDGTPGGLSGDLRSLVLGSYGPAPGARGSTRFAVLNAGTLRLRKTFTLRGTWSYDAVSRDAGTLFLVEHISAGPTPRYRVRALDVATARLYPKPIVDTRENEALMRGRPVTRVTSGDGRWAYTLYGRAKDEPFVHALDTARRQAFCIDLPVELTQDQQMGLGLKLGERGGRLVVTAGTAVIADVDTETFEVRTGG